MKLSHSSHEYIVNKLIPKIGNHRNSSEDSNAINIPVIYFTDNLNATQAFENEFGKMEICRYKYFVNVDIDDPMLFEDKKFTIFSKKGNKSFDDKWYFYKSEIQIIECYEYIGNDYKILYNNVQ